jgi:hypothetical protein
MIGPARKVVARATNGTLIKGYNYDFSPGRRRFHIFPTRDASSDPVPVLLNELKAVFFVRDLAGNPTHHDRKAFLPGERPSGRKIEIVFKDTEVLVGSTEAEIWQTTPGVLLTPADPTSNNLQVYAVSAAIRRIRYVPVDRLPARPTLAPPPRPPLPKRVLAWLLRPLGQPRPRMRGRLST